MKLYMDADDEDAHANLCVLSEESVFDTVVNFLVTKFGEEEEGCTYGVDIDAKGVVFWYRNDNKNFTRYKTKQEFIKDVELLGIEVVHLQNTFHKYGDMIEYLKAEGLVT